MKNVPKVNNDDPENIVQIVTAVKKNTIRNNTVFCMFSFVKPYNGFVVNHHLGVCSVQQTVDELVHLLLQWLQWW